MFESAQEALFSGSARGLAQDGPQTPQYHYHHPRNLAAAAAASMNNRPSLQRTNHRNRGGPQLGNCEGQNWTQLDQIGENWTKLNQIGPNVTNFDSIRSKGTQLDRIEPKLE